MAKRNWVRCVISVGLAFLLSTAGIACLLTTFDLDASIGTVLWWSMLWSVAFSVFYTLRWQLFPIGILAFLAGYLWQSGRLYDSIDALLYRLTDAYNWSVIGQAGSVDLILCVMGTMTAFTVSRTVSGGKSCLWPMVFSALPLLLCVPVSDTAPQPLWLGIWLFGLGLLLLTQPVRKNRDSRRLTALMAAPLALLTLILLLVLPQSAQEKPRALAREVTSFLEEMGIGGAQGKPLKADGGAVELNKLGGRKESGQLVMTVTADRDGTLYLRGCAYNTYINNSWTNINLRDTMYWPDKTRLEPAGQVEIHTEYAMDMRFFPYYASDAITNSVTRGVNNYGDSLNYSYQVWVLTEQPTTYTQKPEDGYAQLPTVTKGWADGVLRSILTQDMTDSQKLAAITDYVRACARYSLHAEKMPESEQDFVSWFAQSAEKGYCVHFATTAAVLCRAAGIPARYVTGYMVQAQAGVPTEVYGKDAHAWVECFLDGLGWVPLEATPGMEHTEPEITAQEQQKPQQSPLPLFYGSVALVALTAVGLVTQWTVRVWLRRRKRRKGDARQRLLECYRQLSRLLALLNERPPQELEKLAELAKFSLHPIDPSAVEQTEKAIKQTKKALKKQPFLKKLHQRLILALY